MPRKRKKSDSSKTALQEAIQQDEKTIKKLEKKLGFNKRKGASAKCFQDLGLGDVWDILEKVDGVSSKKLEKNKKIKKRSRGDESSDEDAEMEDDQVDEDQLEVSD